MKILFPIGSFFPAQSGGPSNTMYWLAEALTSRRQDVVIVATDKGLPISVRRDKWLNEPFGQIQYCHAKNHKYSFKHLGLIRSVIRDCDVVHLTSLFYPPSFLSAFYSVFLKKKVVWSPRGELSVDALRFGRLKKLIFLKGIKLIANKVEFHATSEREKADVLRVFGNVKVNVIPNYIKLPSKVEHNQRDCPYLLYVGRLHPIKALDRLLVALSNSSLFIQSNFEFIIAGVGDSEYVKELEELVDDLGIKRKVRFIGQIEGKQKEELFAQAYFSFLVSDSENFGNVVVEALAQGTPVVTSEGTPWEILNNKKAGYWIKNDIQSISETIDSILGLDEFEYIQYRQNAHDLVVSEFDVKVKVNNWIEFYTTILKDG